MLRARPTSWFELITTRQDYAATMQELARSGAAQLEVKPLEGTQPVLPYLEQFFIAFTDLQKRYEVFWPTLSGATSPSFENPGAFIDETLATLKAWAAEADPVIEQIQSGETERSDLQMIASLLQSIGADYPFEQLAARDTRLLSRAIYFLPETTDAPLPAQDVLFEHFNQFLIAMGSRQDMAGFHEDMQAQKAILVPLPNYLTSTSEGQRAQLTRKLEVNAQTLDENRRALEALSTRFGLPEVLSHIAVLHWLHRNSGDVQATKRTIRITGWTSSESGKQLRQTLDGEGVNYILSIADGGEATNPPMVLDNPAWLKVFEFFPRMLGVPSDGEVDPSVVTALIAPLLFGFMFGDVGQGAVLIGVGIALRRKMPFLFMLVPGGISAMFFGVMFGSVFSREDIIAPLWLHPLHSPITLLAVALAMGAALLFLGILLDFKQSIWRHAGGKWLLANGGIVIAFLSLLGAYWQPLLLWGVLAGFFLTLAGARTIEGNWSLAAAGKGIAEFVEALMRLLVNSVSFSRVGAFALAHAGLSTAIVGVAEAAGSVGYWIVLVFGNLLILGLEGLVVGIQTTRLILFEFFIRFFKASGREFTPLTSPDFHSDITEGKTP